MNHPIGILWVQFGPYHFARARALARHAAPAPVHALEISNMTRDYAWQRTAGDPAPVTICPGGDTESLPFHRAFLVARRVMARLGLEACLMPGYSPAQPLAVLLAAKSLGIRTVMMNESHAGTARSGRVGSWVKRRLVGLFDTALVGGQPQKRYFASLGMPERKIFIGYDAVDNGYFAGKAKEVRSRESEARNQYGLPERYFLSLGRFVPKKNLDTLIRAYAMFLKSEIGNRKSEISIPHLVMVGSGETEPQLRALCTELGLPSCDHSALNPQPSTLDSPCVHFYGFRQIDENPVFYELAEAFILPSLYEEWGLVVNEAMACGLPVIVSETAGCAEDLLEAGYPLTESSPDLNRLLNSAGLSTRIRKNGFVFDPQSSKELGCVLKFVADSSALRTVMGQHSLRIVGRFSCENFARNALLAVDAALASK